MMERQKEKEEWLENQRRLKEEAECAGCTFKPTLISQQKQSQPSFMMRHSDLDQRNENSEHVYERLFNHKKPTPFLAV